ncbi:PREDICTED: protein NUCLEAR FUSION DEFECTIVE 4-like [Fragaria vesca subsp. vesca]|uniref:protein NUCLEAR FUSION DEFECTIVE 4-like n=1 Tax=Fragaria vesca subsp. vesca TaxID=101020 RepID=UPI0002C2FA1D|nr:PREDICTED: protein NUCLEAR FUSION DEFECTIVE 4-like [Fragaria vesca subsp. vesca]XP_011464556.1 PREDICTED: protein NUCLEAR FUSION DEFECTIVE 4-like [Fragaria vesca subsp. vesca]
MTTTTESRLSMTKWTATAASIWIQCFGGASYTFSIYSSALKSSQGYDQSTLDTVSVFKDIGANAGVLSGLLYSAVALNRRARFGGPWVVHVAGAIQCFAGYFFLYAAVAGLVERPPVTVVCLFMFFGAHSQTFFNTTSVVTGVQNFSDYGGTIVGIMKGFMGLSGAILVQFYDTLCKGNPSYFLLLLALLPTLVSILFMPFVRIYEACRAEIDKKYLNCFSAFALLIAAYLMVTIILRNIFTFSLWASVLTFTLLLLILFASPIGIAIKAQFMESKTRRETSTSTASDALLDKETSIEYDGEDMTLVSAMSSVNFWLLFIAMLCGMGTGLATINNMSQLGQSLGYTTVEINTFVSLWSIWNFLGRFGAGYVSDYLLHTRGWARPLLMALTQATMAVGHLVISSGFPGNLYVGSVIVGICYGSQWSLMPTISSEIFGVTHFGTIFNTIAIASPVGSYIFSVRVIGFIYDKEASGDDGSSCSGTLCFMLSFLIMASVAFFGFLVALVLFFRTKRFYHSIVLKRLRHLPN